MSTINLQNTSMSTMENKQVSNNLEIQTGGTVNIEDNSSINSNILKNQGKDSTIEPAYFARATQTSEVIHDSINEKLTSLEEKLDSFVPIPDSYINNLSYSQEV